ncbi:MAG: tRNA-dihydrouridine synthase [Planctomycetes bacterium]|nr:tRNA-dihydrouridine synthase [Planctomycetota bacterium]
MCEERKNHSHNTVRIGPIEFDVPIVQAALSGYSDLPMRRLARRYGAVYTLNEVVLDKVVIQKGRKRSQILSVTDDDHPVGGQLMGSNPEQFGPAAYEMAQAGYDVIDINFGCPVKKVLGRCRGGFLLSQPTAALDIVRRVFDAVQETHPVTVKMRRGMDDSAESERNFFEILDGAFAIGVSAVTVHGRTVAQRYIGASQWTFLSKVKQHVGDKVILGSGDLFSAEACMRMIQETGVDGVTVARGCIGNPWVFQQIRDLLAGREPASPTLSEQHHAILCHWRYAIECHGEAAAVRKTRTHAIKYASHHPEPIRVRDAFVGARNAADFQAVLDAWYSSSGYSSSNDRVGEETVR